MEKAVAQVIGGLFLIIIMPVFGSMFGYAAGWFVALFFDETIHRVVRVLLSTDKFDGITLGQFGATAAFFASWIKPSNYTQKND